jgi:hypothetical protein
VDDDAVEIPEHLVSSAATPLELLNDVFGGDINAASEQQLATASVLAPLHEDVDALNGVAIAAFHAKLMHADGTRVHPHERTYASVDRTQDPEDMRVKCPPEQLHSLQPPGMPPHNLHVKTGMPLILLRNLNVRRGLCNGTRAIVVRANKYSLQLRITSGRLAGETVYVPRITLKHEPDAYCTVAMYRKQYPVAPAFALTINKAQGQTLARVGVYLAHSAFSHGQLYVAASRVGDPRALQFFVPGGRRLDGKVYTRNVVCPEVLLKRASDTEQPHKRARTGR